MANFYDLIHKSCPPPIDLNTKLDFESKPWNLVRINLVLGVSGVVACRITYSVSSSPSPFPLDFGFCFWDLDLDLDMLPGFETGLFFMS